MPPRLYVVVVDDDEFTPYNWVLDVLRELFRKSEVEARALAREIDEVGKALVGVYTYDVAETLCVTAMTIANRDGYPLRVRMERL